QIAAGNAGAALARDLVPFGNVDHVDATVSELRGKSGGQVVAARLDDHDLQARKLSFEPGYGGEIDTGVFPDCAVRARTRLDTDDSFQRQGLAAGQELGVFLGVDVIGDDGEIELRPERATEPLDQRRLARAHRPADTHSKYPAARSGIRAGTT